MPLVSCSPPTCYLTRPRKRSGRRTLPGRCMRPNPWIMFLIRMGGQGFDRKTVSDMYKKWKQEFHKQNPNLSESEMKAKMNDHLCGEIAETSERERNLARKSKHSKETRERRRETAKKNTEARRKKAAAEAKAKEIARAGQKKAAEAAEARKKAEAKAEARAKAAKASDAAKAKARAKAKAKANAAKAKDRKSTALGWDCVRPTTITSSKKERFNSCEKRPGGKYGSRGQCVENCYTTTYSADEILALKADDKAKRASGKGKGKGKGKAIAKKDVKAAGVRVTRGTSKKGRSGSRSVSNEGLFFAERPVPREWNLYTTLKSMESFDTHFGSGRSRIGALLDKRSLETLHPGQWLYDDVIDAYMALLQHNSVNQKNIFLGSLFYSTFTLTGQLSRGEQNDAKYEGKPPSVRHALVRNYTRKHNTTGPVKIFLPTSVGGNHWVLIVVDVEKKRIISMNSYKNSAYNKDVVVAMDEMLAWIEQEHIKKKKPFDKKKWTTEAMTVPRQRNSIDCGVFVCMYAAYFANDRPFNFTYKDMTNMRARMAWSILNHRLVEI